MMKAWWKKHILIIGAARQGLSLARFMVDQGADVIINDQRPIEQMASALKTLSGFPVRWYFGGHPFELLDEVDLVCISGGVPLSLPLVLEAKQRGIPLSNDSQIFMEMVPCMVIGITGSAGKTTTTTMVGRMAENAVKPEQKAWVGGNIGTPLIDQINRIKSDDLVVLELSSFQLELMTLSPQIGVILNITPNHLDRHGTFEEYRAAKARLIEFQHPKDIAVLNRDDPATWGLAESVRGKLITFGQERPPQGKVGVFLQKEMICLTDGSKVIEIMPTGAVLLRGQHNLFNVMAACAIAWAAGFPVSAMRAGVEGFTGVAHRLEFVRSFKGANWYNDSIATAPERTIAAIRAFDEPLVLLLGGRDKNLPWEDLAVLIHERVDHCVVFGEAAEKILGSIGNQQAGQRPYTITRCGRLEDAVKAAATVVEPGDIVLLAPGGTSFDEFRDFEERGERFREWVNQLW